MLFAAFDDLQEADWEHSLGGTHVVVEVDGTIVAHAAVVERTVEIAGHPYRTGYVEGVATARAHRGAGHGTRVMEVAGELVRANYELGALGTGVQPFYERLGWERWLGPTFVRRGGRPERTPEDDDAIMVLRTGPSRDADLRAAIVCEDRTGDSW